MHYQSYLLINTMHGTIQSRGSENLCMVYVDFLKIKKLDVSPSENWWISENTYQVAILTTFTMDLWVAWQQLNRGSR